MSEFFERHAGDFGHRYEAAIATLQVRVEPACAGGGPEWQRRVAAGVCAALDFAAADPEGARVLLVETLGDSAHGHNRYVRLIEHFARLLRAVVPRLVHRPRSTEEALVGSIVSIVADELRAGRPERLEALAPELIEFMLLPYLDRREARRWGRSGRVEEL